VSGIIVTDRVASYFDDVTAKIYTRGVFGGDRLSKCFFTVL
jgi:hypothetical protein